MKFDIRENGTINKNPDMIIPDGVLKQKVKSSFLLPSVVPTGIMPEGVIYMNPQRNIVVFHRAPERVTIEYKGVEKNYINPATVKEVFDLPLPDMIYAVVGDGKRVNNIYMFATKPGVRDRGDISQIPLYLVPITNMYADGRFCIPPEGYPYSSISEMIFEAYSTVWDSNFNRDVVESINISHETTRPFSIMQNLQYNGYDNSAAEIYYQWSQLTHGELDISGWYTNEEIQASITSLIQMVQINTNNFFAHVSQNLA